MILQGHIFFGSADSIGAMRQSEFVLVAIIFFLSFFHSHYDSVVDIN